MGEEAGYLIDVLMLLLATVVIVPIFHAIRLGAILGYLTIGALLGPWGLALFTEVEQIRHLGEFGVILLLFILGIELNPERLWQMRHMVIGLGLGQVLCSAGLIFAVAILLGIPPKSALIIGFGLALSSTAFCLQLLNERGGISTLMGRMSFSVLLLQDLAVIPLLAMISAFAGDTNTAQTNFNLLYTVTAIAGLLLAGRYLLNPILGRIVASRDPEVFIAVAMLLVLGSAWAMTLIGLSMPLGAFLAGLMLAESRYRHQISADILPFRGILLGLFFITVGMGFNFDLLSRYWLVIISLTAALMAVKGIVMYTLARIGGARHDVAIQVSVLLAQSGEFGFVMFGFAAATGVLAADLSQILILIITLSMALTPISVKTANALLSRFYQFKPDKAERSADFFNDTEGRVILAGFGQVGARIGALLNSANVPYIALEMREDRVKKAHAQGFPVFYGDACNVKVLQAVHADRAKTMVISIQNRDKISRIVSFVRQYYPGLPLHARAKDRVHCANLISQGTTTVVSETLETSLSLAEKVLLGSDVDPALVKRVINDFRDDYYSDVVKKVAENKVVMGELKH